MHISFYQDDNGFAAMNARCNESSAAGRLTPGGEVRLVLDNLMLPVVYHARVKGVEAVRDDKIKHLLENIQCPTQLIYLWCPPTLAVHPDFYSRAFPFCLRADFPDPGHLPSLQGYRRPNPLPNDPNILRHTLLAINLELHDRGLDIPPRPAGTANPKVASLFERIVDHILRSRKRSALPTDTPSEDDPDSLGRDETFSDAGDVEIVPDKDESDPSWDWQALFP